MLLTRWILAALFALLSASAAADAGEFDSAAVDRVTRAAMHEFGVPGMAVGVVQGGQVLYARGHGIRELGLPEPVDTGTLFLIASATKAFTSGALAVLADEGRVAWDGVVSDYLPEFRMSDPWVTANISLADLLAHRSGLTPHAGDLLLWPVPNAFTTTDVIRALRHFPLESGFRRGYTYDNLLYLVAGEVVSRVSGLGWGEFVDSRMMGPLGMRRCFAGRIPDAELRNLAAPHGERDGRPVVIERNRIPQEPSKFAPAGGIACSLGDMLTWVQAQLGEGTAPDGTVLFSADQSRTMWAPHNWLGVGQEAREVHRSHFSAYGLGWRLRDVQGFLEVSHTGSLDGMRAQVLMVPERSLGIVVLSNGSSSAARSAVVNSIEYAFLPAGQRDWVGYYLARQAEEEAEQEAAPAQEAPAYRVPARPLAAYTGLFRDPWFGDVTIGQAQDGLHFAAAKSPNLSGPLEHRSGDDFIVRWRDRSLDMDARVRFDFNVDGRVGSMRMERVFENGEEGLDHFEYLRFTPVQPSQGGAAAGER